MFPHFIDHMTYWRCFPISLLYVISWISATKMPKCVRINIRTNSSISVIEFNSIKTVNIKRFSWIKIFLLPLEFGLLFQLLNSFFQILNLQIILIMKFQIDNCHDSNFHFSWSFWNNLNFTFLNKLFNINKIEIRSLF